MSSIQFENDFKNKVMIQSFESLYEINQASDVEQWKSEWVNALKSWHSPYKCLINCSNLRIKNPDMQLKIKLMIQFFQGFFLRSIAGYTTTEEANKKTDLNHHLLCFSVFSSYEEAAAHLKLRVTNLSNKSDDFRSQLRFDNHFKENLIELSFESPTIIDDKTKILTIKSKLTNQLMQWHSPWSLLIDCAQLEIVVTLHNEFNQSMNFFKGLFMRTIVGYQPKDATAQYPFKVYRSRHKAIAEIAEKSAIAGDIANCNSRKPQK